MSELRWLCLRCTWRGNTTQLAAAWGRCPACRGMDIRCDPPPEPAGAALEEMENEL